MFRNLLLIFTLAIGFAAILYFKPWELDKEIPPRLVDRLPTTNVLGKTDVLKLSDNLSKTLFYYKIPFRDFLTPNFLLGQGKNYGLDVQDPVYFFVDEKENGIEDWGVLIAVRDSSKIIDAINRINKLTPIKQSILYGQKVHYSPEYKISLVYSEDWLLMYSGRHLMNRLGNVLYAKHNDVSDRWKDFLRNERTKESALVARINSNQFSHFGITEGDIVMDNDSSSFIFNLAITQEDEIPLQIKPSGMGFAEQEFSRRLVNLHLNIDSLRSKPDHSFYKLLNSIGSKISFPTDELIKAWEGDFAFRQGGIQTIKEKYITSELDEEFNITEVTKTRNVQISGFSLFLSMNENKQSFLKELYRRGILTQEEKKYRLLFSPPLNMKSNDTSLIFYTGKYKPFMYPSKINHAEWHINYTPVKFYLDSIHYKTIYGSVQVPLKKIISDNIQQP